MDYSSLFHPQTKSAVPGLLDCVMTARVLEAHVSQVHVAAVYLYVRLIPQEDHITCRNISRGSTVQNMFSQHLAFQVEFLLGVIMLLILGKHFAFIG